VTEFIERGIAMTKRWELLMLKSYPDKDGSWHVGYGSGNASKVHPLITADTVLKDEAEAHAMLVKDLEYIVPILNKYLKFTNLNPYQYYACLDLAYNRGVGTFRDSAVAYHISNAADPLHFERATKAFVINEEKPDGSGLFAPLNISWDATINAKREYLGLTLRRIDNASLFQVVP
jgi:GH24 family phage-related lysozyme (muramidase)